jgi:hypothetical protein
MLKAAYESGAQQALQHYGLKEAGIGNTLLGAGKNLGGSLKRMAIGRPGEALDQLLTRKITQPGGMWHKQLWPSIEPGESKFWPYVQRAATLMAGLDTLQAGLLGDPNESRVTNILSAAGSGLGSLYGYPAGGLVGGALGGWAGRAIGKRLGRAITGRPATPRFTPPQWAPLPGLQQAAPMPSPYDENREGMGYAPALAGMASF